MSSSIPERQVYSSPSSIGKESVSQEKARVLGERVQNIFSEKPLVLNPHSCDATKELLSSHLLDSHEIVKASLSLLPHSEKGERKFAIEVMFHAARNALRNVNKRFHEMFKKATTSQSQQGADSIFQSSDGEKYHLSEKQTSLQKKIKDVFQKNQQ